MSSVPAPQPLHHLYAAPQQPDHRPNIWKDKRSLWKKFWALRAGDKFLVLLGGVLLGYALFGRGFAYWGYTPVFIGEITLAIGVYSILKSGKIWPVIRMTTMTPLLLFIVWGAVRTLPFIPRYGPNAIRDAVIWGYAAFAFIIAALLIQSPRRLIWVIKYYRFFCYAFLISAPIVWLVYQGVGDSMPVFPGGENPIIQLKGGDTCVHISGCFAYIVNLGGDINPWLAPVMIPLNMGMNMQGRAGLVCFVGAVGICFFLRPFHRRILRVLTVCALGVFFLWITDIHLGEGLGGANRDISFDFLKKAAASIVGAYNDDAMDGSRQWRENWWHDIMGYAVFGKYKWTGKGFGINLADDDGYQIDGYLRSPHNGHMTVLARSGLPGITLWGLAQGTWFVCLSSACLRARRKRDWKWTGLFGFLVVYWTAFMINASFDVFIEGPMGGIWLWVVYGTGIGALHIYRTNPQILYDQTDWDRANDRAIAKAVSMGINPAPIRPAISLQTPALPLNPRPALLPQK